MTDQRLIIAGGSGFIGTLLSRAASARGYEVVVLTRQSRGDSPRPGNVATQLPGVREVQWDGQSGGPWAEELDGAGALVNLAGRSVNCRFRPDNLRAIERSRVNSVLALGEALRHCSRPPRVFIQAAGEAIYGDQGENWCDEESPPGKGFLVPTCLAWEGAFQQSPTPGTRRVLLRIGVVLSAAGGALKPLLALTRLGLGGRAGSGRQFISWVHADDLCRVFLFALERQDLEGVFNVNSPNPASNAELMAQLRAALHRPWSPPVPVWAVRLGAWLLRTEPQLALSGVRCRPKRLLEKGFSFTHPHLAGALGEIARAKVLAVA
jgi:hypothetical protein